MSHTDPTTHRISTPYRITEDNADNAGITRYARPTRTRQSTSTSVPFDTRTSPPKALRDGRARHQWLRTQGQRLAGFERSTERVEDILGQTAISRAQVAEAPAKWVQVKLSEPPSVIG